MLFEEECVLRLRMAKLSPNDAIDWLSLGDPEMEEASQVEMWLTTLASAEATANVGNKKRANVSRSQN